MPDLTIILRQGLLFVHVLFFAVAISEILREDLRLLTAKSINPDSLHKTANIVKWVLIGLWITGLLLIYNQFNGDFKTALEKPKIAMKFLAVTVLTVNGFVLHFLVFPMLTQKNYSPRFAATISTVFGAISSSTWLYASFVGVARHVAPYFKFEQFLGLYLIAVTLAISIALLLVRERVEGMLQEERIQDLKTMAQEMSSDIIAARLPQMGKRKLSEVA